MKATAMIFRLSFLIALLVGVGGLFHFYTMTHTMIDVHIVAGLMMLVALAWMAWDTKSPVVGIAVLLVLAGGALPLVSPADPLTVRMFHLIIMIVAVALAEMGLAQTLRRRSS
ncbi:MAG: hypothetical protein OWU33_02540 [Firmicutes bacterium]|jgi:uncharacterized membrane protein|nr:hypothetical protein [Bacillota bacterium]